MPLSTVAIISVSVSASVSVGVNVPQGKIKCGHTIHIDYHPQ